MAFHLSSLAPEEARYIPHWQPHEKTFARTLVNSIAQAITEEQHDTLYFETGDDPTIEIIPGVHCSGYIPFTEGGYESVIPALLNLAWDLGYPEAVQPYINADIKETELTFCQEHNLDYDNPDWYNSLSDDESEELFERTGQSLMCGGTYFYKVRLYKPREGAGLIFNVYLNTDFEYGRDYISWVTPSDRTVGNYKRTFTVSPKLTQENIESISEKVKEEVIEYLRTL